MKQYVLKLTELEREHLLAELLECPLRSRIFNLRERDDHTAGKFDFRGLECSYCGDTTSHFKKHKSNDGYVCDECGTAR